MLEQLEMKEAMKEIMMKMTRITITINAASVDPEPGD